MQNTAVKFPDPFEQLREENRTMRADYMKLSAKYCDALLAMSLLTGHKPPGAINAKCQWRAEEFVRRFKAEEDLFIGMGPDIK